MDKDIKGKGIGFKYLQPPETWDAKCVIQWVRNEYGFGQDIPDSWVLKSIGLEK